MRSSADAVGLVVAVEGVEWHRKPSLTLLPIRSLPNASVRDVAQCAVPSPEASTDPIGMFAAKRAVGVVDPDEPDDAVGECTTRQRHRNSIADRAAYASG